MCFAPIPPACHRAWGGPLGAARIRVAVEDFQVLEVPLVEPCGEGEHSWLRVRKRSSNTPWVAQQLARFAGVAPAAVSYAGLKDRHAVTEQWFSVHLPGRGDPDWSALQDADFSVLSAQRHLRKLKIGALRGNWFTLRIRDLNIDPDVMEQRLELLRRGGFPNYFGVQRFGRDGANLRAAAQLFQQPKRRVNRSKRGIYLSAVRSALFNRVLSARVASGSWNRALPGDALQLDGKSACFVADALDAETLARVDALQIHPTGPLYGEGEPLCRDVARALEAEQWSGLEDWLDGLRRARLAAARRALRVVPGSLQGHEESSGVWVLAFYLPAGSYATSLLDELIRVVPSP